MRKRINTSGSAPRRLMRWVVRYGTGLKNIRRLRLFGLFAAVVAAAALWIVGRELPAIIDIPPDPVEIHFVDANFSHEQRPAPSKKAGFRNVSHFTLIVELRNNTKHDITARSADFYDKAGYFLLGCRIVGQPQKVASNSAGTLRCTNRGRLPRKRVDRLLRQICEIDMNLAGRGLRTKTHPVPWPRTGACVS
ncbi:MAG: hypothetical protein NXI27_06345 [Alphaproteobacteria bacterium]|nr:hypothetical protein [Alphaproteobacteria bacterium]